MENIIPQYQTDTIVPYELFSYDKRLRKPIRARLLGILETDTVIRAVSQKTPESRQILRSGNDEDVPYPSQHQYRYRIVDHRLVIDWEQLLAHSLGNWI